MLATTITKEFPILDNTWVFPILKNHNETKKYIEHVKNTNPRIDKIISSGNFSIWYPTEDLEINTKKLWFIEISDCCYWYYDIDWLKYWWEFRSLKSLVDMANMFSFVSELDIYLQIDYLYCLCQKEIIEDFKKWYDEISQNY